MEVNIAPPVQFTRKVRFLAGESVAFAIRHDRCAESIFLEKTFDSPLEFVSMSPAQALIELVKHSFLLDIEMKDLLAAQFEKLSALVSQPLCYQLNFPRSFDSLAAIRQAIVSTQHMRTKSNELGVTDLRFRQMSWRDRSGKKPLFWILPVVPTLAWIRLAQHMWQAMVEGKTLAQVCERMLAMYEVSRGDIERDVLALDRNYLTRS
ncbi:MAG: PqqD family protein [Rhodoferax sp.]|nr:PqqD family protein [Rhodoferax sp.]